MSVQPVAITRLMLLTVALGIGGAGAARAQPAPASRDIPQGILLMHEDDINELTVLARRRSEVGAAAQKALDVIKRHHQREVSYILPPLTLLPAIAEGRVTPDMRWAITMADKIQADHEAIFAEHTEVTDAMNALLEAADKADDKDAADFAHEEVADSLNDLEVEEPAAILVGEFLRARLAAPK